MKKSFTKFVAVMAAMMMTLSAWGQPRLASEYCNTTMGSTEDHGAAVGFTWETNAAGDVIITLSEVDGGAVGTSLFRSNGMCPDDLSRFKVGGENASYYFEREYTDETQIYTLKLKDGIDAPAAGTMITFNNQLVEYKTSANPDAWPNLSFSYTYGSKCAVLDKPTNLAISSSKVISFDAVSGATSYKAFIYWSGELISEQVVTNGDVLDFHPSLTGMYNLYVQAYGSNDAFSPISDAVNWDLTAELPYLPQSDWCGTLYEFASPEKNAENVNVTWVTDVSGNIVVTFLPVEGVTQVYNTEFRNPMSVSNLKIGENDLSDYFTSTYSGNVNTFALKDASHKPTEGTILTYRGMVEYRTGGQNDAWPDMQFEIVYGSNCLGYNDHTNPIVTALSVVDRDVHSVTFHVEATDEDDLGTARSLESYKISSVDYDFITTIVTPNDEGNFTINDLKDNATYTFTVHAIDFAGNEGTADIEVVLPFNTDLNLALGRGDYCTVSNTQGANSANKAVDGNSETFWTSYDTGEAPGWWRIDLGVAYDVNEVKITFNDIAAAYNIEASADGTNWVDVVRDATASKDDTKDYTGLVLSARYFKVTCPTSTRIGIREFEVYGTAFSVPDVTIPTVSVTCPVKTINSATLQINAADLVDSGAEGAIATIRISGDHGFETLNNVTLDGSNQITLEGLNYNTTYTFTVTAIDRARNEGSTNIEVVLPFNTNLNLAQGKPAVAGKTQGDYTADKGCDGKEGTMWSSFGTPDQSKEYWYVDLGDLYTIRQVRIKWMNDYAIRFLIQGVSSLPAEEDIENDDAWTTYLDHTYTSDPGNEVQTHDVVGKMRYLRLKSLQNELGNGIEFYELEVYGSDFAEEDNVAPIIETASCTTDSETGTVTFTLIANDVRDGAIADFYISCADPEVAEAKYTVNGDHQVSISGLEVDKDYTFAIRCRDLSGNWVSTSLLAHFSMVTGSNVAQDKTATAGYEEDTYTANKAVDGNAGTRWGNYGLEGEVSWWKVDLANAYRLDHFVITWEHFPEGGMIIEGSLDDNVYTTIITCGNQSEAGTIELTGEAANTPYRYIRVKAVNLAQFMSIYEFEAYASEELVLLSFGDNAVDNSSIIETYHDNMAIVTINRNILANDGWYTLCLPFDMSEEKVAEVFGGSQIAELTGSEDRGSLIHLNFDYVHAIEAGHAYLIKPGQNFTAGSTIEGVTIENVEPVVSGDELMHFQGTYNQTVLSDENVRFVADDDYLYSPADGGTTMGAFRCYFTIPEGSIAGAPGRVARIFVGEQVVTGIDGIQPSAIGVQKLLRDGQLLIIRDGRTYNAQGILVK